MKKTYKKPAVKIVHTRRVCVISTSEQVGFYSNENATYYEEDDDEFML